MWGLGVMKGLGEEMYSRQRRVWGDTYLQQHMLSVCVLVCVFPTPQKGFVLTQSTRTIYTAICKITAIVYSILSTKQESVNIDQSFVLGIGIATATMFICGALLFFSMMEEGKAEHFFSTETIAEYQKRQVEEILAMDTSIEYELKIRGIQVDKDIYIAWLITIRYSGYLPTDLFQKLSLIHI